MHSEVLDSSGLTDSQGPRSPDGLAIADSLQLAEPRGEPQEALDDRAEVVVEERH